MKSNILIISVYYPPKLSIASNRIYSFAKYLDKSKYNIFVHTVDEGEEYQNDLEGVSITRVKNNPLLKTLPFTKRTNKIIHYAKVLYNKSILQMQKNIYQKWIDNSYTLLKQKIKEENIDLIISSFAPDASHVLALRLKQEFPHLKWIADMRDEMSQGIGLSEKTKKMYQKLEKEIFQNVDALTSVSKPLVDEFASLANNDKMLFKEIRNGYDFEMIKKEKNNTAFVITYTGNFYGERNPNNFLQALSRFIAEDKKRKIKVQLVGVKTHFNIPTNLLSMIEVIPPVGHQEAIEIMQKSDALLLIHPSNGRKGIFTGKLFEYLATLTPIIALVDENDVAAALIKKANAGYVADNSNGAKIYDILIQAYSEWENRVPREFNKAVIQKHHRYEQAKRLENLIEELLNER